MEEGEATEEAAAEPTEAADKIANPKTPTETKAKEIIKATKTRDKVKTKGEKGQDTAQCPRIAVVITTSFLETRPGFVLHP